MTLQSSGPISLLDLKNEFDGTNPVRLGDYYRESTLNTDPSTKVPTSGAISIGMFYELRKYYRSNHTITSDTNKLNLHTYLTNTGWNGVDLVNVTITINSGIVVYSDTTATPAFTIPNTLPNGSAITIINNGFIIGMGGDGGGFTSTSVGKTGGTALLIQRPVSIRNNGTIGGGGGGGGGQSSQGLYGGGGGRSGRVDSTGGTSSFGQGGQPGTFASAGEGAGNVAGGTNAGGDWGESGVWGNFSPGAGGNAVEGSSYITWVTVGIIKGVLT